MPRREPPSPAVPSDYALSVEGLGVRFGARQVLEDVSFRLAPGSVAGLIGSNGAGKTTLLRAILGRQSLSSGSVHVAGQIGYVPQKFLLDPDLPLRGRDLVGLGLDGHRYGLTLPSRTRRERVAEMLDAVGASDFADTRVGRLSGGEQQRILIAHALISEPALLLLDEPLANLDLHSAKQSVELLARIARARNLAVFISAHELNQLLPVLDHVVYLADGRAVAGATDEVIRQDVLSRLYRSHVDVIRVHGRVLVVAGESGQVVS
ncbi:metal ABC transporter ATP-binding protein [Conexibacter sp. DBS9H8]|uniref:metal ABC transporter ATP-binding protein n=1 Tax=Conexibacter sp. DBS9H8 TaxID=2937801 RepID=UPI00200D499B|nr:metal ABC transporter ATP-binding protein [Conexibacter sp. DBS9H8]